MFSLLNFLILSLSLSSFLALKPNRVRQDSTFIGFFKWFSLGAVMNLKAFGEGNSEFNLYPKPDF